MSLRCIDYSIIFALLFLAAATAFGTTPAGNYDLPPAWQTAPSSPNKHRSAFDPRLKARPWYQPRAAVGVGLGLPEVLPFEAYLFFGHYAAVRFFFTPELPVKIRIEMPADVVSTKKGIGVATPDFTINMQAAYGPHYGAEALLFPFAGSFFVGGGVSYRKLKLTGQAKTPVLICSLLEAAKDPPCGDARAAIQTETQLGIQADAFTSAILLRGSFGWFWHVGNSFYMMFNGGLTKPMHIKRSMTVKASVDSPGSNDELTGALQQVKEEREVDLENKALKEIRPFERQILPILGLTVGVRF